MLQSDASALRLYPLEYIRLGPMSVLPNLLRHVAVDALMQTNFSIVVGTARGSSAPGCHHIEYARGVIGWQEPS